METCQWEPKWWSVSIFYFWSQIHYKINKLIPFDKLVLKLIVEGLIIVYHIHTFNFVGFRDKVFNSIIDQNMQVSYEILYHT